MEDWPSFAASFHRFVGLLADVGAGSQQHPPTTISVLSGDIHFSYAAQIHLLDRPMTSRLYQLVNSPIRNALTGPERTAMRLGKSRLAGVVGRVLRRAVRQRREPVRWTVDAGPVFDNCIGELTFDGAHADLSVLRALPYDADSGPRLEEAIDLDLAPADDTGR